MPCWTAGRGERGRKRAMPCWTAGRGERGREEARHAMLDSRARGAKEEARHAMLDSRARERGRKRAMPCWTAGRGEGGSEGGSAPCHAGQLGAGSEGAREEARHAMLDSRARVAREGGGAAGACASPAWRTVASRARSTQNSSASSVRRPRPRLLTCATAGRRVSFTGACGWDAQPPKCSACMLQMAVVQWLLRISRTVSGSSAAQCKALPFAMRVCSLLPVMRIRRFALAGAAPRDRTYTGCVLPQKLLSAGVKGALATALRPAETRRCAR